ncbi:MAG: type II toxin-antitoxin system MqsA family antitoxin [bacterium]|nr:type II toxin-antitoxin system MqsA family antitoxin [bacterium]
MKFISEHCPICESGRWEPKSDDVCIFRHGRKTHKVIGLHYAICNICGTRGYLHGQRKENQHLIQNYQSSLLGYISPSDVLAIREKYELTQKEANKIFGGGSQGFSKWERGVTSPAGTTARLIKLALKYPEVMRALAKESDINLAMPTTTYSHNIVIVNIEKTPNHFDNGFTDNDSIFEVEEDDLWPVMEKNQPQASIYLN